MLTATTYPTCMLTHAHLLTALPRREFAAKQQLLPLLEAAKDKQKQRTAAAGARK